jgi:hypothetical protein
VSSRPTRSTRWPLLGPRLAWLPLWGLLAAPGCLPAAAAGPGHGSRPVLVELFTSQGCSSCPAADAFVRELPRLGFDRATVVPLTFHVNYWDELGWPDPFATPAFTERQRRYASAGGLRTPDAEDDGIHGVYTPQMIVDGAVHFSGGRRDLALTEIRRAAAAPALAELTAEAQLLPDRAVVTARVSARQPPPAADRSWRLLVALAAKSARTHVTRGENRGETLEEAAIVRVLSEPVRVALSSAPTAAAPITVARPRELAWSEIELVVLLQSETTLHVAAVRSIPTPGP